MEMKTYYSIVSTVRFSRNEENRRLIEEYIKKGETHFLTREDDYGECFEVDLVKEMAEEVTENWLLEMVIGFAKKYKITEFELWKKHKEDSTYDKGFGIVIEGSMENPIIKFKEVYSGSLEDWNLSWNKGKQTYEKIYFKLAL
ncbi:DUF5514 family protein [Bacillus cereus]|uniref:Uncharacterized protein n=1 Tax=Bacillus cereus 03BB108 TaxID=451709 RepID=A0AAN0W4Q6_BACCE|nr:DUF5514 family protein [Bacillus cereus]AJI09054.1 hypothetical protein AK40_6126 [Bacillus cereus 03BB108]EDX59561.1 conserved hypothetical protein [Bacillus cereus 03BB108]MBJ6722273.1 DUF5514 family protein [Bacillus sp. PR5]QKG98689.1 DUF5514 family protein [Bacillus cereus]